jgi:signal transduction histidine kinase
VPNLAGTVARVIDSLQTSEFEARSRDGTWYSFRVRPYESEDNRIDGAVVTAVDIDALKAAEAARHDLEVKMFQAQKLESLGVMAGGVAHDLNNLLTPVVGYAGLARSALPPESPAQTYLAEINEATRLATDLIKQILSYSGKSHREVRVVDLSDFVRSLTGLLTRAVANKAELRLDLMPAPLLIAVDPPQLSQVILNLVTNAGEAMTSSRGTVTIRTAAVVADRPALNSPNLDTADLPEGRYAVLEVADTGSGMSGETLARLFDPFYTTKFTGRGLGLAAVLGIVRGHRGTIRVSSEPGLGSTFRVLLPITDRTLMAPSPSIATASWRGSGLVLVVDDDAAVCRLIDRLLTNNGFEVIQAPDGTAALEVFRSLAAEVRVVLIDLTMPGKSGLEVAGEIRKLRPDVPILLASGYSNEAMSGKLISLGINGFLHKPFSHEEVLEALRVVLGNAG